MAKYLCCKCTSSVLSCGTPSRSLPLRSTLQSVKDGTFGRALRFDSVALEELSCSSTSSSRSVCLSAAKNTSITSLRWATDSYRRIASQSYRCVSRLACPCYFLVITAAFFFCFALLLFSSLIYFLSDLLLLFLFFFSLSLSLSLPSLFIFLSFLSLVLALLLPHVRGPLLLLLLLSLSFLFPFSSFLLSSSLLPFFALPSCLCDRGIIMRKRPQTRYRTQDLLY